MGEQPQLLQIYDQDGKPVAVLPDCQVELTEEPLPEEAGDEWSHGFSMEWTGNCTVLAEPENIQQLMNRLSRSMRFDRKTLRRLFHAVTHRKQVWFDVVIEFGDGTIDEGGLIVRTPHELRFLLNKIRHIRTPYRISDRED